MKACQSHSNFRFLTNIWPCKPLVKIYAFWFSDSILRIKNTFPTCCLNQWYLKSMCFNLGVILIYISIKIHIMYHIDLTCIIINNPLDADHRKNCCRIFVMTFGKPDNGNPPYLIVLSIYVGVSGSWPRDIESIRLLYIIFGGTSIWYSTQYHPVTMGCYPYQKCYNNPHQGSYNLNLQ